MVASPGVQWKEGFFCLAFLSFSVLLQISGVRQPRKLIHLRLAILKLLEVLDRSLLILQVDSLSFGK